MICITNSHQIAEFTKIHSWRVENEYLQAWLVSFLAWVKGFQLDLRG